MARKKIHWNAKQQKPWDVMQKEVEIIFLLSKANRRKPHGKTMNFEWLNMLFRNTDISAYIFLHFYTLTMNKRATRWNQSVPKTYITAKVTKRQKTR